MYQNTKYKKPCFSFRGLICRIYCLNCYLQPERLTNRSPAPKLDRKKRFAAGFTCWRPISFNRSSITLRPQTGQFSRGHSHYGYGPLNNTSLINNTRRVLPICSHNAPSRLSVGHSRSTVIWLSGSKTSCSSSKLNSQVALCLLNKQTLSLHPIELSPQIIQFPLTFSLDSELD